MVKEREENTHMDIYLPSIVQGNLHIPFQDSCLLKYTLVSLLADDDFELRKGRRSNLPKLTHRKQLSQDLNPGLS